MCQVRTGLGQPQEAAHIPLLAELSKHEETEEGLKEGGALWEAE